MSKIKRIYIEITNKCNLRCSFCSFHHRPFDEISIQDFEEILIQIKPITSFIYLHVQGEPLLHSKLDELMTICDQQDMNVQIVTNGTYINQHFHLLHHPSLRKMSFSLHSLDYQGCDIELYLKTILDFSTRFTSENQGFAELRFWVKDNLSEKSTLALDRIKETFDFKPTSKPNSYYLADRLYLHFENQFEWPNPTSNSSTQGTCRGGKDMLAILVDGTIIPCCLDAEGIINFGNIHSTTLSNVLLSERYLNMIKGFNDNKIIEPLCKSCTFRNRFD